MPTILLVEDDPMISDVYTHKFQEAGFNVVHVTSGRAAIEAANTQSFDIILLDIVLPEVSGLDVLKTLRERDDATSPRRIFMLSNLNDAQEQEQAYRLGANGFIPKARFTPSQLVDEVHRILVTDTQSIGAAFNRESAPRLRDQQSSMKDGGRVLIVEDEEVFRDMFALALTEAKLSVICASDGVHGLNALSKESFDIIIVDIVMPRMDGIDFIAHVRKRESDVQTPIVVLSASYMGEELAALEQLKNVHIMQKTHTTPRDLAETIVHLIAQNRKNLNHN